MEYVDAGNGNGEARTRAPLVGQDRLQVADWIRSFRWTVWATPTFEHAVSRRYAVHALWGWLRNVSRQSYAIAAVERGPTGNLYHVHALVGGIPRQPLVPAWMSGRWREGRIAVVTYDRTLDPLGTTGGASWYLTKGGTEAVDIFGSPVVYRPRRRGSGGG